MFSSLRKYNSLATSQSGQPVNIPLLYLSIRFTFPSFCYVPDKLFGTDMLRSSGNFLCVQHRGHIVFNTVSYLITSLYSHMFYIHISWWEILKVFAEMTERGTKVENRNCLKFSRDLCLKLQYYIYVLPFLTFKNIRFCLAISNVICFFANVLSMFAYSAMGLIIEIPITKLDFRRNKTT